MCRSEPVDLAYNEAGEGELVVILHGFLGSGRNWQSLAKRLAKNYRVVWVDMRNHGASPWSERMSYPDMASDIVRLIDRLGRDRASVIGHSMGGKAAMTVSILHADRVDKLVIADIAPVAYDHGFDNIFAAMRGLDLSMSLDRRSADSSLSRWIDDAGLRAFILQNLDISAEKPRWRCNLDVLVATLPDITGWAVPKSASAFTGPALFLYGERSDYVGPSRENAIRALFPSAMLESVADAGHWLHADAPQSTLTAMQRFLKA